MCQWLKHSDLMTPVGTIKERTIGNTTLETLSTALALIKAIEFVVVFNWIDIKWFFIFILSRRVLFRDGSCVKVRNAIDHSVWLQNSSDEEGKGKDGENELFLIAQFEIIVEDKCEGT